MSTETSFVYRVHRLPKENPALLAFLSGKFAALRLNALVVAKASFSSTFQLESTFPASFWISRLSRPEVETFLAIAYAKDTPLEKQTVDCGDIVGSSTLLGPVPKAKYDFLKSGGPVIGSDEEENKWQLAAVYANPAHRGRGLGKMLIVEAYEFAIGKAIGKRTRVRAIIHPDNKAVYGLYLKLGYMDAGKCTLEEAFVANGDGELVPSAEEKDPGHWNLRIGLVTEKTS